MNTDAAYQRQNSYLIFTRLANYLPKWEICTENYWGGGTSMLVSHDHIQNGAQVCSTITTLEDFSFRIPFHRECHALLESQHPGVLRAKRMVKVHHYPVFIQEGYEELPSMSDVCDKKRIEWITALAQTFDSLFDLNLAVRRVSLHDVVFSKEKKPLLRSLGWLATYFPTEDWREKLESSWDDIRRDLISFLGIVAELFSLPFPKQSSLRECLSQMVDQDIPGSISCATDIADVMAELYKTGNTAVLEVAIPDWSIETLHIYHECLSMVCAPKGRYTEEGCIVIVPNQTWISQRPISRSLFALVLNRPSDLAQEPVTDITWWEAVRFCNLMSRLLHKKPVYHYCDNGTIKVDSAANGFRLPYSMEWLCVVRSNRDYVFQENSHEWMQDRLGARADWEGEFVFEIDEVESTPLYKNKRVVDSKSGLEGRLPSQASADCGFRVVLNLPVE